MVGISQPGSRVEVGVDVGESKEWLTQIVSCVIANCLPFAFGLSDAGNGPLVEGFRLPNDVVRGMFALELPGPNEWRACAY